MTLAVIALLLSSASSHCETAFGTAKGKHLYFCLERSWPKAAGPKCTGSPERERITVWEVAATGERKTLFRETNDQPCAGQFDEPSLHHPESDWVLRIPFAYSGTGHALWDRDFVLRNGDWRLLRHQWGSELKLPPLRSIRKGRSINWDLLEYESALWFEDDCNACASGGRVRIFQPSRAVEIKGKTYAAGDTVYLDHLEWSRVRGR